MYRYHNPLKNFNPFVITSVFVLFLIVMFTFAIPTLINAASTMMNFIAIIFILFTIYICIIVMRYYNDYYCDIIRNTRKKEKRKLKINLSF